MGNIVLIILDTVRKDYFDKYASRLKKRSNVSFTQCRASSAWSVPSHGSILTGKLPHKHGVHSHNPEFSQIEYSDTFFKYIEDYSKIGISANKYASEAFGFDAYFDDFQSIAPAKRFSDGLDLREFTNECESDNKYLRIMSFIKQALKNDHTFQSLANGILTELNNKSSRSILPKILDDGANIICKETIESVKTTREPFFAYLNFMDAHAPFHHIIGFDRELHSVPNSWTSSQFNSWEITAGDMIEKHNKNIQYSRELYRAAIDYLDKKVSYLIDKIQSQTKENTTFIITSDHGENLAFKEDNHLFTHSSSLTEGLLHVPCEIVSPPQYDKKIHSGYFSQLNFGKLIRSISSGKVQYPCQEEIVAELIGISPGNWSLDGSEGYQLTEEEFQYFDRAIRCLYLDNTKMVLDSLGNRKCYIINKNKPNWQLEKNISECDINKVDDHNKFSCDINTSKEKARQEANSVVLSYSTRSRLKDLGYL